MKKLAPICSHNKGIVKQTENRKNKTWSSDEIEKAKELHRAGYSLKGIASILGRPACGVVAVLQRERKGKR